VQHVQTLTQVNVKGAQIAYYERGAGRPVLLLHGSPDSHVMWLPLIDRLVAQARCIAIDLPGFGESTLPDAFSLSLDNMADFIHDLLSALHITEPITLVTTDFGGHYGAAFAAKYPDTLRGIAISNTNFFHDYHWHSFAQLYRTPIVGEVLLATSSKPVIVSTMKRFAPALSSDYVNDSFANGFGSARVRKTILRMYRGRDSKDFLGWEDRLLDTLNSKPAIVLWGDRDPFITPDFADRWGKAEVHHFTEYSHWLPLEAPDQYAAALIPWLKRI
jgi:haloalkane dehalogenase